MNNYKEKKNKAIIYYGGFKVKSGGAFMHATSIKKELILNGWDVTIVTLENLPFYLRYLPHIIQRIINIFKPPMGFYYKDRITRLLYIIFQNIKNADLYIFEDVYLSWETIVPSVTILHAVWSDNLQAYKLKDAQLNKLKIKEAETISKIKQPIATVSNPYKNYLLNHHFKDVLIKKDINVIELGLDLDQITINEDQREELKIIYCGTLESRKNILFLIEVFELLFEKKGNATLTIIGEGPDRKRLEKICIDKKIPVAFKGKLKHEDVILELKKHSIYIHTSVKESFSYALLEAKLCGLITCAYLQLEVPSEFIDIGFATFESVIWANEILKINNTTERKILGDFSLSRMTNRTLELAHRSNNKV